LFCGIIWIISIVILLSNWQAGTYLGLELVWALPAIILQLAFGADILWQHRNIVITAIVSTTIYLSIADALAIQSGTWTIDPAQSTELLLFGILPIEEFIFFLLTNILIIFGVTLVLAAQSQKRISVLFNFKKQKLINSNQRLIESDA
jgi:lycopene cyclase domain-containing protein